MIEPIRIPLGVSDPEGRIGAIRWNDTDIDAVDLGTGGRLRRLSGIGTPLLIEGQTLLGWQSLPDVGWRLFRVGLPPAETGVEWSAPFDLPVTARTGADADQDFAHKFGRDGNAYVLFWKFRPRYRGGAPPPAELRDAIARERSVGRIDFDARTLAPLDRGGDDGFADERARAVRGEDLARRSQAMVYRQAGELRNAPWRTPAGERFLGAVGKPGDTRPHLAIMRADTATAVAGEIEARDLDDTVPELALDGRHLAIVGDEAGTAVWRIYDTTDGAPITHLPYRDGFRSFCILNRRLLFLEEQTSDPDALTITVDNALHAWDTATRRLLWTYRTEPATIPNHKFLPP